MGDVFPNQRTDTQIRADRLGMKLLRDVATRRVITVKGNYASALMALPLVAIVGELNRVKLLVLQEEGLVHAPEFGPPALTARGRRLLGMGSIHEHPGF